MKNHPLKEESSSTKSKITRSQSSATTLNHLFVHKEELLIRFNKIEGQIRGIKGMVEKETYCDDILIQVGAVQSALYSTGRIILENHMRHCLQEKRDTIDSKTIDKLFISINRLGNVKD